MSKEVDDFISQMDQPWKVTVGQKLHKMVVGAVPDATEEIKWKMPHFMKNGKYLAVIAPAKGWVALTIFNTGTVKVADGIFESGVAERKTIKIKEGQDVPYDHLSKILIEAAKTL